MRRIAFLAGSRADESPLKPVMALIAHDVIKTSGLYGNESHVLSELERLKPDMVVCLGDRIETLLAATLVASKAIPLVHIHGGEVTEGSTDDSMRHAITKLAYYHFTAHQDYANRVIQMGEDPGRVFVTGAPGLDNYAGVEIYDGDYSLVCLHPETLGDDEANFAETLKHIDVYSKVITANQDHGGDWINRMWQRLGFKPETFPPDEWAKLVGGAKSLIGNSSGFIIEGIALGKKVIMIGDRQKGRYEEAQRHFAEDRYAYGKPGEVSPKIAQLLMTLPIPEHPRKPFRPYARS